MIRVFRLYFSQQHDFDRGWTIESLKAPCHGHAKNGRFALAWAALGGGGGGLVHSCPGWLWNSMGWRFLTYPSIIATWLWVWPKICTFGKSSINTLIKPSFVCKFLFFLFVNQSWVSSGSIDVFIIILNQHLHFLSIYLRNKVGFKQAPNPPF